MADLPSGSTIGGERIIHKGIANKHRHDASEIQGLTSIGSPGDGGGIDADVLSGKTYSDLSFEFVRTSNDNISSLILNGSITNNSNAAPLSYLLNNVSEDIKSGNFFGITSIGDLSQNTFDYSEGQYTVTFDEMDVLINGRKYFSPTQTVDVRDVTNDYDNKIFYFYMTVDVNNYNAEIIAQENNLSNSIVSIFIGEAIVDGSGVAFNPIEGVERIGVAQHMLSRDPKPYSIVVSDENGKIPMGWINGGDGSHSINLLGPTTVFSSSSYQYRITNYNVFSNYEFSVDNGEVVKIDDETYEIITPDTSPNGDIINLTAEKDDYTRVFEITVSPDPVITLSGPTSISTNGDGNVRYIAYTIGNYNNYYSYNVSVTVPGISFYQRSTDQVILEVPATNPSNEIGVLEVSRTGSSASLNLTFNADPDISLSGPDIINENSTEYYTINNYNPAHNYSHSATLGTTSRSGDTIIYNSPDISSDTSDNITIQWPGSSDQKTVMVQNIPEDFNTQLTSGSDTASPEYTETLGYIYDDLGSLSPDTMPNGYFIYSIREDIDLGSNKEYIVLEMVGGSDYSFSELYLNDHNIGFVKGDAVITQMSKPTGSPGTGSLWQYEWEISIPQSSPRYFDDLSTYSIDIRV